VVVRLPDAEIVVEAAPEETFKELEANKFLQARAKDIEPTSTALFEPGCTPPVVKMLPEAEIVDDAEPDPTRTELDAFTVRQAAPKLPKSYVLLAASRFDAARAVNVIVSLVESPKVVLPSVLMFNPMVVAPRDI